MPLTVPVLRVLEACQGQRTTGPLILRPVTGNPIDRRDAYRMVARIAKAAGIPRHISPHSYNASVYRDGDGNVLGVFAAARDVTEQIEAQRRLAEEQAKELDQQANALERLAELERFQRLTVGRELKMIELKKEIEHLRKFLPTDQREPGDQH